MNLIVKMFSAKYQSKQSFRSSNQDPKKLQSVAITTLSLEQSHSWFIADRKELFDSFVGKVPLLALKIEHIHKLKKTFENFGLNALKLSLCA